MLPRRDLLTAFLGSTVASACLRQKKPRRPIEGARVDRALEAGHLLRQKEPLPRLSTPDEMSDVVIVGAGAAGLSAGWRLQSAGLKDFTVFELDTREGGTAQSGQNALTAFPWGAHYLPAPRENSGPVMRLLHEMGLVERVDDAGMPHFVEEALVREPEERLYYRGYWYEGLYLHAGASEEDLAEWHRFEAMMKAFASAKDAKGRKAFDVPLSKGSPDSEWTSLDSISMAAWLRQHQFQSPRLWWYVGYACRDDFGALPEHVSAYAGIWYFAARRDADSRGDGYLTWPEGNARLIAHLAKQVGPSRLRKNALVHALEPVSDGVWVHWVEGPSWRPRLTKARKVILAVPQFVAARLWQPWAAKRPDHLSAYRYSPWVVANLSLRKLPKSRGFSTCWDNVLYESQSLGYVVATHQHDRAHDGGPTHLTWYYPMVGADVQKERQRLLSLDYPSLEELVVSDLSLPHPDIAEVATRLEVMRWGHAMIRPDPGFLFGAQRKAFSLENQGVYMGHSDMGGLPLFEEANHQGVGAAEKALRALGKPFDSWL